MKKILLGIAIAGISITAFGNAEYPLSKKHYLTTINDISTDSTIYVVRNRTDKYVVYPFNSLQIFDKAYDGIRKLGVTPISAWGNKDEGWRSILCKYNSPTAEKTRCIIKCNYNRRDISILLNFVVDGDLPKVKPKKVKLKEIETIEIETESTELNFDNSFDSWFNKKMSI